MKFTEVRSSGGQAMKRWQAAIRVCQLTLLALCGCAGWGGDSSAPPPDLTSVEQTELATLSQMLTEPDSPPKTRYQAATLLLARPQEPAGAILADALADRSRRPAGVAVARAVAEAAQCRPQFVEALFQMLIEEDEAVRLAAAEALGTSRDPEVLERLCAMASDTDRPGAQRLACVRALARVLDRSAIETLIQLLEDGSPDIRLAAADGLARLTGIRSFGPRAAQWQAWWHDNRDKPHQQWLADLAESLAAQNVTLHSEIDTLRRRLAETMRACHEGTPAARRGELVLAMLQDPLPEVRAAGLELATRQLTAREPLVPGTADAVRALVDDADPAVRAPAAMLLAGLQPVGAEGVLLGRLKAETVVEVRVALVKSLGSLKAVGAFEPLLTELAEQPNGQAVAAAGAIQRLAEANLLSDAQAGQAVEVIIRRYEGADGAETLRAALLADMRVLGRTESAPVMRAALADKSAAVRLEAVRGLMAVRAAGVAQDVVPLMQDADRGVRQAAMEALAVIGDQRHIEVVLEATAATEADLAVRQKAWETVLVLLDKADTARIAEVAQSLAGRPEAREYRIRALTMLVDRLRDEPPARAAAQVQLGELLLAADQPARAAEALAGAMPAVSEELRGPLWLMWIEALLRGDDPGVLTALADQRDAALFAAAMEKLTARLEAMRLTERHAAVVALADQALQRLSDRLAEPARQRIENCRAESQRRGREADAARVAGLLKALNGGDSAVGDQARRELVAMGKRAALPLVEQFRSCLEDEASRGQMEKVVPALLSSIDGQFTGYDPAAPLDDRVRVVEAWRLKAQP